MEPGVTLQCQSCGKYSLITEMYYCSACNKVLCNRKSCICEDPELPYCPVCFDIYPPGDATKNSLRCPKCFQCPECLTQLIKKKGPKKDSKYYWLCPGCNWRSTFIGIEEVDEKKLLETTQRLYSNEVEAESEPPASNEEPSSPKSTTNESSTSPITAVNTKFVQTINNGKDELEEIVQEISQKLPQKLNISGSTKIGSKLRYLNMNRSLLNQNASEGNSVTVGEWNSDLLREKLQKKEEENKIVFEDDSAEAHLNRVLEECNQKENENMVQPFHPSITYQNSTCYIYHNSSILPVCVPLRSKKHKKCLACLKNNVTTFLVKSVANPLKGDSFNIKIKDDWYSVQCFAIVTYPILSLIQPFPQVMEDRFRIRIMNISFIYIDLILLFPLYIHPCNIHGSLVTDAINVKISQYSTPDTNCKVQFPAEISIPGADPATYTENTEPVEYPEFVESIGPNYVILYTYIEKEEDVPPLFYLQLECEIHEQETVIHNTIVYRIQVP